ncbi:MAG: hypothetical protein ACI8PQ_001798 [Planctomycetota bacterium]
MNSAMSGVRSTAPRQFVGLGLAHLVIGWGATLLAPVWVLLLAPLIFGVPHVLNDLRLLIWRPVMPVNRRLVGVILVPLVAMTLLRVSLLLGAPRYALWEVLLGFLAVVGAVAVAFQGRGNLRWWLMGALVALGVACCARPKLCGLFLGHAHNLIAIGFWLWLLKRANVSGRARLGLGLLFLAMMTAILAGVVPAWSATPVAGLSFEGLRETLAPGLSVAMGERVVLSFAFAQLMHYSVWMFLMPGCAWGQGEAHTIRDWSGKLGRSGVLVALLALPLLGLIDPIGARSTYLSFVLFHGWLEIALVMHWLAGRAIPVGVAR